MGKILDFLKEQIYRSTATNCQVMTNVSSAIARKDVIGVIDAITEEIKSAIKDIAEENFWIWWYLPSS